MRAVSIKVKFSLFLALLLLLTVFVLSLLVLRGIKEQQQPGWKRNCCNKPGSPT